MIRLRALGTVDLRGDDGGEIRSVLMQPKRLALFAYLALARPRGFQRRDTLISVFWPDAPADKARQALNQAVHVLRRSLGPEVIAGRGADELSVAPERVSCDAWELESALAGGDATQGLELYRGELLTGLALPDAGEFERWLDNERKHWSGRVLQALRDQTDHAEAACDLAGAVGWARRTLDQAPYDEPALVRLMQLLARRGDRVAAIHACERFSDRLWNDVELRLSPATREVLSRIKREAGLAEPATAAQLGAGVVGVAPVAQAPAPATSGGNGVAVATAAATAPAQAPTAAEPAAPLEQGPGLQRWGLRRAGLAALALVAVVGAGVGIARLLWPSHRTEPGSVASLQPTRVAVTYFDETDPAQHLRPLADGLTEALIDQLNKVQGLSVISANGVRPYRGTSISPDSIRRALHTSLLISGSVDRSGDLVRVLVQLVDTTGVALFSRHEEKPWSERLALIDALSGTVSGFLREALGREIHLSQARAGTRDVTAWELFRRGKELEGQGRAEKDTGSTDVGRAHLLEADSLFGLAGAQDPGWSEPTLARAGLARALAFMAFTAGGGARAAKERLAPALDAIQSIVKHNPSDARAVEQQGLLRYYLCLLSPPAGTLRDTLMAAAERDLRRAVSLDPDRADAWSYLSTIDHSAGRLAAAKADAERAYAADAYLLSALEVLNRLFSTSFELHQDADARRWCSETERRFGHVWVQALCSLMLMGWADRHVDPQRAWETYDAPSRVDSPDTRARTRPMLAMLLAATLARAGLPDSARHVIARAHAQAPQDAEVLPFEAGARLLLGDSLIARQLMAQYLTGKPNRASVIHNRILQPLSLDQGQ